MIRSTLLALLIGSALQAQNYVRPFSAGGTLSFFPLSAIAAKEEVTQIVSSQLENRASGQNQSRFYGGGITVQAAFSKRYAIAAGLSLRSAGYRLNIVGLRGVDNPDTDADDRPGYTTTEETRARYYELPILLRRFSQNHREEGFRWFYEGGATFRRVSNVRSSTQIDDNTKVTCCDETPVTPANRTVPGITLGAGFYMRDDFGIRLVPEIRYTRWLSHTFNNLAAPSRRHQIELLISFTF